MTAQSLAWLEAFLVWKVMGGVAWEDMVKMGDKDLEDKGVAALGARRKLLKSVARVFCLLIRSCSY